jgi:molybdopterin converting factor small subunit
MAMKITLRGVGPLRDHFKQELQLVQLPDDSNARNLLQWIEEHCAPAFPRYLWDFENHQFRGPVAFAINGALVLDWNTPLQDDCEVCVMYAVAGG